MTSDPTAWHRSLDVAYVDDGDRVAVLALDALDPLGARLLAGPAALVWRAAGVHGGEKEIAATVAQNVGADVATVLPDVQNFLIELEAQGLILKR